MDLGYKMEQESFEKKDSQQNLEDSSHQDDKKFLDSPEQQSPDQFKQDEEKKYESKETIEDKLSYDVEEKYKVLENMIKGKNEEQVLNLRMHQLALAKILVFTHGKNQFILIRAHTDLGEAYLNYKCNEQAIDHLTIALKKNGKLFKEIKESPSYHSHILTLLGKTYLEIGSYEDSLELLDKAYEIQKSIEGKNSIICVPTLTLISNCYTRMKDYDKALENIDEVYSIVSSKYDLKSESIAIARIEAAKIYALKEDYDKAIENMISSIEILVDINYDKHDYVAELYNTLAGYQEKINDKEGLLSSLKKVRNIYQELYGPDNKKVIVIKRQISIKALQAEYHQLALDELLETEVLETKLYGENSLQVAKTQKILGTVYIFLMKFPEAQKCLLKSMKVFEENGVKKAVGEIKAKLKYMKDMKDKARNDYRKGEEEDEEIE